MKNLILVILISFITNSLFSQELISYDFLGSKSKAEIVDEYGFGTYDVDFYKIVYTTKNAVNQPDTASGLLIVPVFENLVFPSLIYQHGTVGSREDVPSNLQGGYQLPMILASMGYITTAADFIGLGDSPGSHPYIHAESEANAAIDMLIAVKDLGETLDYNKNEQLFITGYSQGGHAGMAAHWYLERDYSDQFTVTAASHMSGPYSVSEKMIESTLGDDEYFFVAYLANVAISMKTAYPTLMENYDLADIFKPEFIPDMEEFRNEEIDLFELNQRLIDLLNTNYGSVKPKFMVQDSILPHILAADDHPVPTALKRNDVYDWAPKAPTRLFYCKGDDQVFWENAVLAEEVMNANGAVDLVAVNKSDTFDHGECVSPATESTIFFWFAYQQVTSIDDDISFGDPHIRVFPNPASDELTIELSDQNQLLSLDIYDFVGNRVARFGHLNTSRYTIDLSNLDIGNYLLMLNTKSGLKSQRVVVTR